MFKWLSLKLIKFYQFTASPDHGLLKNRYQAGFCRFYPTCSEYTYSAIKKYGFFKGWYLGLKRILKCNPFSLGGYDEVK